MNRSDFYAVEVDKRALNQEDSLSAVHVAQRKDGKALWL